MADDARLEELLLRWEQSKQEHATLSAEALCQECPELLPRLRWRIQALLAVDGLLGSGEDDEPIDRSTRADRQHPLPGGEVLTSARYRLERTHARGGLSVVLAGRDERLQREVALKFLQGSPGAGEPRRRRFLWEAEVTSRLEHPGIVPVYGVGEDEQGRPCYAMRLIHGDTLAEAIRRLHEDDSRSPAEHGRLLRELLGRFVSVCNTIAYAHSRGVLHRDLKPANIIAGPFGETLVVDWGLAKVLRIADCGLRSERPEGQTELDESLCEEEGRAPKIPALCPVARTGSEASLDSDNPQSAIRNPQSSTAAGTILGTPAFMSPEQAAGDQAAVGTASDIFGLGATLYALLTGRAPFGGTQIEQIIARARRGEFPRPRAVNPSIPRPLEAVCLRAMAPAPAERYVTALDVARDVEQWLADEPVGAYREPLAVRAGRWVRRHKPLVAAGAAALVAVVLLGGGGWLYLERRQAVEQTEQARQDERRRLEVTADLREADERQQQGRWPEARAALGQATARLGAHGPSDLQERLARARHNLDLVARLDAIRLAWAVVVEGRLDYASADRRYAAAFREAALGEVGEDPQTVARRVQDSPVQAVLVAALDDWSTCAGDPSRRAWVLAVARQADPDPWRDRARDPVIRNDRAALAQLVQQAPVAQWPPALLTRVGAVLQEDGVALLRAAVRQHPPDFWLNFELGNVLANTQPADAVGYYRAALALRPGTSVVFYNLGIALKDLGRLRDAEREFREAATLDPNFTLAHTNLGNALAAQNHMEEAEREFRTALALEPGSAQAHTNLGNVLKARGHPDEAMGQYREALALDSGFTLAHNNLGLSLLARNQPQEAEREFRAALASDSRLAPVHFNLGNALAAQRRLEEAVPEFREAARLDPRDAQFCTNLGNALSMLGQWDEAVRAYRQAAARAPNDPFLHYNLGIVLAERGQWDEAVRAYREAVRLRPNYAEAHCNLGLSLQAQGRFAEALEELKRGDELGSKNPRWSFPSRDWIAAAERLAALDRRLAAVLGGENLPTDPAAQAELAELCQQYRQRYALASQLYADAFAQKPELADDLKSGHRYNAACAAALAGCGRGVDAGETDKTERTRWRRQALDWLKADLAVWTRHADRAAAQQTLRHWQQDTDLAGVRDPQALARLQEAERATWRALWHEVTTLLTSSQ